MCFTSLLFTHFYPAKTLAHTRLQKLVYQTLTLSPQQLTYIHTLMSPLARKHPLACLRAQVLQSTHFWKLENTLRSCQRREITPDDALSIRFIDQSHNNWHLKELY